MKLNWGTAIAIFYTCFVIAMVTMVVRSTQNKMDLVQENYYEKDLAYESFRAKRQNASVLTEKADIKYSIAEQAVEIALPKGMSAAKGKLNFFRPSNKQLDTSFELEVNEKGQMLIPVNQKIKPGLWRIQLDWEYEGQAYFQETSIVI